MAKSIDDRVSAALKNAEAQLAANQKLMVEAQKCIEHFLEALMTVSTMKDASASQIRSYARRALEEWGFFK